jgi:hypothetical protein
MTYFAILPASADGSSTRDGRGVTSVAMKPGKDTLTTGTKLMRELPLRSLHARSMSRVSRDPASARPNDTGSMFRVTMKRPALPPTLDAQGPRSSDPTRQSGKLRAVRASRSSSRQRSARPPSPMSPEACLLETPYCRIVCDAEHALARFVRTGLRYASIEDIDHDGIEVERALDGAGKIRLLVDLRSVMPRNDPDFEVAIAGFRRRLLGGGQRTAILVQTAVGALQVNRHMREDGFHIAVFDQEEAALDFLRNASVDDPLRSDGNRLTPVRSMRRSEPSRLR